MFLLFFVFLLLLFVGCIFFFQRFIRLQQQTIVEVANANSKAVLIIDHESTIKFANHPAIQYLQINPADLPFSLVSLNKNEPEIIDQLLQLQKLKQQGEKKVTNANGEKIYLSFTPIPSIFGKKRSWLVIIENTSLQVEANQAKIWIALARRLAHDIKNPLTSIQLSMQRLQQEYQTRDYSNSALYNRFTFRILEQVNTLRRMSRSFSKFIEMEKADLQLTNLNEFIEHLFTKSIIELPRDIELQTNFCDHIPEIYVDRDHIEIMIKNLISNAKNAMINGGTLSINTYFSSNVQLNGHLEGDYVLLEIADTGSGIPQNILNQVEKSFISTIYYGKGLGLALIKKIVGDHKGTIKIKSKEGEGTTFLVYLPISLNTA